jgi:hypothetical protein
MNTISVQLPDYLHKSLRELAQEEKIDINQLIVLAVAEKISALKTADYLAERAANADRSKFEAAMAHVADVEAAEDDRL